LSQEEQRRVELTIRIQEHPRLGPAPDLQWMAELWQAWLEPQMSRSLIVLPCPHSRTELVATWVSPVGGPRHAFRFLGGVVIPTGETVGELSYNLSQLAHGQPVRAGSLLRPEPLHFEQVALVLEHLRLLERAQDSLGAVVLGSVVDAAQPPASRPSPAMTGRAERHEVHLTRAVTAVLVETHETLHVWGTRANGVPLKAGERLAWVDGEASIEGLRELQRVIGAALERRARGDE
jgi:hypothetical protein